MSLLWERGYERTGIADLAERSGVRSGSIYHLFGSKEGVLLAVLEAYLEGLMPIVMDPAFARESDPIERVFAVLADYRERVVSTNFAYRCPIGSLALEMQNASDAARALIDRNFTAWRAAIVSCLLAARERFKPASDLEGLAAFVLTVMEGGVMQAAAQRSIAPYDASIAQLRTHINALLTD